MGTVVDGYHGTSQVVADLVMANGADSMRKSDNSWDWLGYGAYFWQDGPNRAKEWATSRHPTAPAVLHAEIDLEHCMDLVDLADPDNVWVRYSKRAFDHVSKLYLALNKPLPVQSGGKHPLDREVINRVVVMAKKSGRAVWSVRGVFEEGDPLFVGSAIHTRSHIQIAVRDSQCIKRIRKA